MHSSCGLGTWNHVSQHLKRLGQLAYFRFPKIRLLETSGFDYRMSNKCRTGRFWASNISTSASRARTKHQQRQKTLGGSIFMPIARVSEYRDFKSQSPFALKEYQNMARSKPYPSLINITDLPVLQLVGVNPPVPGPYFHPLGCTMMSGGAPACCLVPW